MILNELREGTCGDSHLIAQHLLGNNFLRHFVGPRILSIGYFLTHELSTASKLICRHTNHSLKQP